jgi:CRISPR-associated protein Csm1
MSFLTHQQRDRVWEVSLASLLHDLGKPAQRAEVDPERYRTLSNLHIFARTDEQGRTQYHHAAYTWQFIEEHIGWLLGVGAGGDDNVAGWAARHHKPSTVWDCIVAESDQLSAGMDRGHPDEAARGWAHVQAARLTPVLTRVSGDHGIAQWELPLVPLGFDAATFPEPSTSRSQQAAFAEYTRLFHEFRTAVDCIPAGNVARFFQSFLTVYERYTWCVPAATNSTPCDVSLFEHSRAASAIAAALTAQLFATQKDVSEAAVRDRSASRYLLVVADLSGIQRFLYTIVTTNAARALRGRSFVLQLLADGVATYLLGEFGLPPANTLFNGGGKLWLLLPAAAGDRLLELAETIDVSLQAEYGGRLGFGVGLAPLSGDDLIQKRVAARWVEASSDLHRRRRRRFSASMRRCYEDIFAPFGRPGEDTLCHVCGKLSEDLQGLSEEARRACPECRDLERLGNLLTRAKSVVRVNGADWRGRIQHCRRMLPPGSENWYYALPEALNGGYLVSTDEPAAVLAAAGRADTVLAWIPMLGNSVNTTEQV